MIDHFQMTLSLQFLLLPFSFKSGLALPRTKPPKTLSSGSVRPQNCLIW